MNTRRLIAGLVTCLSLSGCCATKETPLTSEPTAATDRVRHLLDSADPADLGWSGSGVHRTLASVLEVGGALDEVAHDPNEPATRRFKAYEANAALGRAARDATEASRVYARAFAEASWHDAWGYPDGSPAGAGARIVGFGRVAIPALLELLPNTTALQYEGSEEPTMAALRRYRVKDLAAVWLAAITGESFDASADDPAQRDQSIARLAESALRKD